jgi:hypothetical protein
MYAIKTCTYNHIISDILIVLGAGYVSVLHADIVIVLGAGYVSVLHADSSNVKNEPGCVSTL